MRKLIELGYERALRQSYLGFLRAALRRPARRRVARARDRLRDARHGGGAGPLPHPVPVAERDGDRRAAARSSSCSPSSCSLLDAPQRRAVFAHEAAHILSDHRSTARRSRSSCCSRAARGCRCRCPVRTALMEWGRATELSADRAAALVTRDPLVVCRTLMSLAGGAMVEQLDLDVFMRQGTRLHGGGQRPRAPDAADARSRRHAPAARQAHPRADGVGALRRVRPHRRRRRVSAPRRSASTRARRAARRCPSTPSASATRSATPASRSTPSASSSPAGCAASDGRRGGRS